MNATTKKVLNIALKVLVWLLVAFTVFMMVFTIVTVTTVDKNDRSIFGMKFYIVQTDSMSKSENNKDLDVHFNAGDIVIIKNLSDKEKAELKAGDIIAFISPNNDSLGETITHMIREVKYNRDGKITGFVTYGTNTGTDDEKAVEPGYILGKYTGKLPGVGNFFAFVKSVPGYIVCILVPFLLLILYNGVDVIRLFRRYKKEQMDVMQAEKDQIEADRAENQRMMQELLALKAQLEQKSSEPAPESVPEVTAEESTVEKAEEPVAENIQVEETPCETEEVSDEAEAPAHPEEISEETQETTSDLDESNEDPVEDQNGEPEEEQIKEDSEAQPPIEEPASEANSEEESTEEPNEATEEDAAPTEETPDEN